LIRIATAAGLLVLALPALAQDLTPEEAAMRAHVAYLASDALRGREAGTPDYDRAAAYVVEQFKSAGLQPGGDDGGWYQKVPLAVTRAIGTPSMTLNAQPLAFNVDFGVVPTPGRQGLTLNAPVVFAGYGIVDAATGRDDYRGLDVRGKVVAIFYSGPKGLNGEVAAHLGNRLDRAKLAKARGAAGVLLIYTSQIAKVLPFERATTNWDARRMAWTDADGTRDLGAPSVGMLSFQGAAKLFAGYQGGWEAIRAAEDAGKAIPTGPLQATIATSQRYETTRVTSENVIGRLPGSDARLSGETMVLSAHLDHIGITRPVEGDSINNGAEDNATGIATLIETARLFHADRDRPRRSVLFLAVTAEEKGLVGSDYFAQHPTVPHADIVANVNFDMPILTYRFQDLVAFGAERSSIGRSVAKVAQAEGFALTPDPTPEEASFVRTDHYSFVRTGIPSVSLEPGPAGPGKAATEDFLQHHYHQPSDDMTLPFDWTAARAFVKVNYLIAKEIANAPDRPRWVKGDYFGTLYKGPMAK
jgi:hypothetical protein